MNGKLYIDGVIDCISRAWAKGAEAIDHAADLICEATEKKNNVYAFGCSHAGILAEEIFYRSGGMGVVADICEDIVINNLRIGIKAGREEYYSTTADGIFLTNCKGRFQLCNSSICNTYTFSFESY